MVRDSLPEPQHAEERPFSVLSTFLLQLTRTNVTDGIAQPAVLKRVFCVPLWLTCDHEPVTCLECGPNADRGLYFCNSEPVELFHTASYAE